MQKLSKKILVGILAFNFTFSPIFANRAQAQWIDIAQQVKEFGLDTIGWMVVNRVIERITASTVNWINTGFQGSPAYISDPGGYFQNLGDNIAGQYIFSNPNLNALCGPIQARIRLALTENYIGNRAWRCTLTDVTQNVEGFFQDFDQGGWDAFVELTQRRQNNPIGAYLQAKNELEIQLATRQGLKERELQWGSGFLSFKTCKRWGEPISTGDGPPPLGSYIDIDPNTGQPVTVRSAPDTPVDPSGNRVCLEEEVSTPGAVIENKLNNVLNLGEGKLEVADELNEVVSALLNQLVSQIVGGIGSGLRGLSSPSPTNNNQVFTQRLTNSTETPYVGYFCYDQADDPSEPYYVSQVDPNNCEHPDAPDTSVLNQPPPAIFTTAKNCEYIPSVFYDTPGLNLDRNDLVECSEACLNNPLDCKVDIGT